MLVATALVSACAATAPEGKLDPAEAEAAMNELFTAQGERVLMQAGDGSTTITAPPAATGAPVPSAPSHGSRPTRESSCPSTCGRLRGVDPTPARVPVRRGRIHNGHGPGMKEGARSARDSRGGRLWVRWRSEPLQARTGRGRTARDQDGRASGREGIRRPPRISRPRRWRGPSRRRPACRGRSPYPGLRR